MKNSKLLMIVAIVIVFFSFFSLSYKSRVFADTTAHCCENKQCEGGILCGAESSMFLKPLCQTGVTLTCKDCVDFYVSGCLCSSTASTYCTQNDGSYYYGSLRSCITESENN